MDIHVSRNGRDGKNLNLGRAQRHNQRNGIIGSCIGINQKWVFLSLFVRLYSFKYTRTSIARGGSPYDVAKLLGDTIETIEKHYTPFVRELRERVRRLMENGEGLENWAQFGHSDSQTVIKKQTTN